MSKSYTFFKNTLLLLILILPTMVWGNGETRLLKETEGIALPPPKPACAGDSLTLQWLIFRGITHGNTDYLIHEPNFPQSPTQILYISELATPSKYDDNFGTLIRGYIRAPESGNYLFNVTGDDYARFYLSTDDLRDNMTQIAYINGFTGVSEYDKYPEQTSETIALVADTYYYFEAISKEGGGNDFLRVQWKYPSNSTTWELIDGVHLYEDICQPICASAGTSCDDGDANTQRDIEDGFCNCAGVPNNPPFACIGESNGFRALFYDNISGNQITDLTDNPSYPLSPTRTEDLKDFRTSATNSVDSYGTRMRTFLRVPVSGDYQFCVTGNDRAIVYLSSEETPNTATDQICFVNGSSLFEFDDEPNQVSVPMTLQAGQFYSMEVIHKENSGNDYVDVFWKTPYQLDTNWHIISGGNLFHYNCELATLPLGTPCDDGDNMTFNDQYDGSNNCAGTPCSDPQCTNALNYIPYAECGTTNKHSNHPNDAWQSCQPMQSPNSSRPSGHWIQYDLGQTYTLNSAQIWNYNAEGATGEGFQTVEIDYSLDGTNWTTLGTYDWEEATGDNSYTGFLFSDLNGVVARYLLITAIDNFDGGNCYGLSEIIFSAVECAPPGTACDDDNPMTIDDLYDNNCVCMGIPGINAIEPVLATDKSDLQIYPSPTRTWTNFYFNIPESTNVRLGVFTASGQLRTWVINGTFINKGQHIKHFPAQHLSGGVYYVSLFTNEGVITERLVIVD